MNIGAMPTRRLLPILPLVLLPALMACHRADETAPLPPAALQAVVPHSGAPRESLARAIEALYTDPAAGETRAFIILRHGQIVAERYGEGYGPTTRFIGWSMSKTVTATLIGLLVADGRLRLDQPAPIPAWQRPGDPRGEITLRDLLQMRSGLKHRETADPVYAADTVRMLFLDGRDDMAAYAEAQPMEDMAGQRWRYSTATSVILADIVARTLTDSRDAKLRRTVVDEYLHTRLIDPLGLRSMVAEYDAAGTLEGGSMIHANARDWARFGQFLLDNGDVKGTPVLPEDWVRFMTTPSPANPAYGGQVWLNRPSTQGRTELFPDQGPASLFACIGHLGQYILVSPKQDLVVVRLGKTPEDDMPHVVSHLAEIVALFGAAS